jgi:hypothetical protein
LSKSQKIFSNDFSNELAIYPKLISTSVARGYLRARTGVAIANFSVAGSRPARARRLPRARNPSVARTSSSRANKRRRGSGAPVAAVLICGARNLQSNQPVTFAADARRLTRPQSAGVSAVGQQQQVLDKHLIWTGRFGAVDVQVLLPKKNSNLLNYMIWQVNFTKLLEMLLFLHYRFSTP